MKNKAMLLTKNEFIKNVIVLTSGTAIAQIVSMIISPIITRLYGPEAFGLMGTFTAITAMITPVAALTFPIAIVLPKQDSEAEELSHISLITTTLISIIVGMIIIMFHRPIVQLFNLESIESYLYLIPLIILSAGTLQVIEQWLIRTRQFKISANATFLQSLITNSGKVGVGIFYPVSSVLIIFSAITEVLKTFLLVSLTNKTILKKAYKNPNKDLVSVRKIVRKYKDFPLYRAPQTIIDSISTAVPVLMLASFFGPASVGFYNIGRTVLNMPTQLIGKSVGDVFYPKISRIASNKQSVTKALKNATIILIGIGIVPYGTVVVFGPTLFSFVFGSDWQIAGEYARWIALWSFSSFIFQPAVRALPVLMAQKFHLIYTVISLVIRILMLAIGYYVFSSDLTAIGMFGISSGLLNVGLIITTLFISKKFDEII